LPSAARNLIFEAKVKRLRIADRIQVATSYKFLPLII
jgi:hypothetical protein